MYIVNATLVSPSCSFLPLPCLQVRSLCLHLYSCPADRLISTIFLHSIYMLWYMISVFLFLTYFTLYDSSRFIHNTTTDSISFHFYGWVTFHFLRNLYVHQEATVRTRHGKTDWFQIGTGVCQGSILSPCLFNLHAEYIMRNARLDEAQAGIKTAGRNINNLRYADDTTLTAESKEELKSLLMKVKEESEKTGWELSVQKTKIMVSGPITSWQIDGETVETVRLYFLGLQNHCRWWLQPWN